MDSRPSRPAPPAAAPEPAAAAEPPTGPEPLPTAESPERRAVDSAQPGSPPGTHASQGQTPSGHASGGQSSSGQSSGPVLPKIIPFQSLARCGEEIWIENEGQVYRLRRTRQGKLILTK